MNTRIPAAATAFASTLASIALILGTPVPAAASSSPWLDRLNAWRAATNLAPLAENTTWDAGDVAHSTYMVKDNQVTHYETAGLPYYTAAGDTAARNGNIQVSSTTATTDETAIDWWMGAPFHALGMMDPRLTSTGFGAYRDTTTSPWQAGFTLDTLRGNSFTGGTYPVYFPGSGSSEPLTSYSGNEFPDPLQACPGYAMPVGLPIFVEVGGNVATTATNSSLTSNGIALPQCTVDSNNSAVGSNLTYRGAVLIIPRTPLVPGQQYTAAVTVNGTAYTWTFGVSTGGTISPPIPAGWTSVGGIATSAPAVTSSGASNLDVFTSGNDNALWHRSWNGTAWGAWESLGGIVYGPGAVSRAAGTIDVFVRGKDRAVWTRSWNGTSWSAWTSLGGVVTSNITVASWAPGRMDIVVRGQDNALWHRYWNGSVWAGWDSVGGIATSGPAALSTTSGTLDIVVRGTDGALWHKAWTGSAWSGWSSIGGTATLDPAVASCAAGHLDVYTVGQDGGLWSRGFNGSAWGAWTAHSGLWATGPGVICPATTTTVQVLEVTYGEVVVQATATGS